MDQDRVRMLVAPGFAFDGSGGQRTGTSQTEARTKIMLRVFHRTALLVCLIVTGVAPHAAQTCRTDIPPTHPAGRLIDHTDGRVVDLATGLMWAQCAEGLSGARCATGSAEQLNWQQALQRAADSTFAGYSDWRLPNRKELDSLVERRCYDASIDATAFPNTPSKGFWSSSPSAGVSEHAWVVEFGNGDEGYGVKSGVAYVRLVRNLRFD
jgi:hypothetical protein